MLVLPLPGGPYRNSPRPSLMAWPNWLSSVAFKRSSRNVARSLFTSSVLCCSDCSATAARYDSNGTGAEPTYEQCCASRRARSIAGFGELEGIIVEPRRALDRDHQFARRRSSGCCRIGRGRCKALGDAAARRRAAEQQQLEHERFDVVVGEPRVGERSGLDRQDTALAACVPRACSLCGRTCRTTGASRRTHCAYEAGGMGLHKGRAHRDT